MKLCSSDINKIERLNSSFKEDTEPMLRLFSEYIAGNDAFRYNRTYLTDSFEMFFIQVQALLERRKYYLSKYHELIGKFVPNDLSKASTWFLIFDDLFVFSNLFLDEMKTIGDLSEKENIIITNAANEFSLFNFNTKRRKIILILETATDSGIIERTWTQEVKKNEKQ